VRWGRSSTWRTCAAVASYVASSRRWRRRWWRRKRAVRRRGRHGAGGRWSDSGGVDELGDAREPTVTPGLGGPVPQQLLSHEQRGVWSRLAVVPARGNGCGMAVRRWRLSGRVKGGGLPFCRRALLVLGAGAATRVCVGDGLGVDPAGRPALSALAACLSHGDEEVEEATQPPTWRAKCRGFAPRGYASLPGSNTGG